MSKKPGPENDFVESYLGDEMYEEERIMAERAAKPRTFDTNTLKAPLRTIHLPTPVFVSAKTTIGDAIKAMQEGHFGCVLVEQSGKLAGIFTERDVLFKLAGKGKDWGTSTVGEFMTPNPESLPADASFAFALNMMTERSFRHIPIVDKEGKAVGILSMRDVMKYIAGFFEKEVKNLPPRPDLLNPTKTEGG